MAYSFTAPTRTNATKTDLEQAGLQPAEVQEILNAQQARKYGGGMSAAELQDFEALIGRLEGSKMRQAGQANRARQRDVMAGGLASMMTNF
jgi:hypothetical protein